MSQSWWGEKDNAYNAQCKSKDMLLHVQLQGATLRGEFWINKRKDLTTVNDSIDHKKSKLKYYFKNRQETSQKGLNQLTPLNALIPKIFSGVYNMPDIVWIPRH